jgi:hypothetical protein
MKARDKTRIRGAEIKFMTQDMKYSWMVYERNEGILKN